jgi:hypothetical protein
MYILHKDKIKIKTSHAIKIGRFTLECIDFNGHTSRVTGSLVLEGITLTIAAHERRRFGTWTLPQNIIIK